MKKEFTASVYLIENQKVLLIFHHKLKKWLPPGGHFEHNETPDEVARREVKEETGFEFEFLGQNVPEINRWNAKSIPCPYLCLLEEIPAYQDTPAHQHIDFIFVGRPLRSVSEEDFSIRWFTSEDLKQLHPDSDIFQETLEVIEHLFQEFTLKPIKPAPSNAMQEILMK